MLWIAGPITRVQGYARHLRHRHIEADDTTIAVCAYASGALGVIEQTTSVYPTRATASNCTGSGARSC